MKLIKLALICLSLRHFECFGYELEGIEFASKKVDSFNVTVNPGFDFSSGFAFCLRVMFYFLNPSTILNCPGTLTLELRAYQPGRGVIQVLNHSWSKIQNLCFQNSPFPYNFRNGTEGSQEDKKIFRNFSNFYFFVSIG